MEQKNGLTISVMLMLSPRKIKTYLLFIYYLLLCLGSLIKMCLPGPVLNEHKCENFYRNVIRLFLPTRLVQTVNQSIVDIFD